MDDTPEQPQRRARPRRASAPVRRRRAARKKPELQAGSVISTTFQMTGRRLAVYLAFGVVAFLPALGFEYWSYSQSMAELERAGVDPALLAELLGDREVPRSTGSKLLGMIISLSGLMFLTGAVTYMVIQDLHGRDPAPGTAISISMSRLLSSLGIALMISLLALVLFWVLTYLLAFLIVPLFDASLRGILVLVIAVMLFVVAILLPRFCVSVPVTIVEKRSALQSMARSDTLTRGVRTLIVATGFVVYGLPMLFMAYVGASWGNLTSWKAAVFAGFGSQVVGGILLAVFCAVVYHDARTSSEGIDTSEVARVFA